MAGDRNTQINTQERRAFILELRKSGASYRQIADATIKRFGEDNLPNGFNCLYASKDVKRELEKLQALNEQQAEDIRAIRLERINTALLAIWPQVKKGHLGAIDRFVRLDSQLAKLTGTDSPEKMDLTSGGEPIVMKFAGNVDPDGL